MSSGPRRPIVCPIRARRTVTGLSAITWDEHRQRAFHTALVAEPSPGFLGSFSAGVSDAPWAADGKDAYEDWYFYEPRKPAVQ
jgi:hypothetical protein